MRYIQTMPGTRSNRVVSEVSRGDQKTTESMTANWGDGLIVKTGRFIKDKK
jgi:hypothetical protein